ncbi:MAG TPA: hypothetical protein VG165_16790 [Solirubrobacteraceae bacterium]|nr:hypothetical protein [Solirubrobacteraceae bacterium]
MRTAVLRGFTSAVLGVMVLVVAMVLLGVSVSVSAHTASVARDAGRGWGDLRVPVATVVGFLALVWFLSGLRRILLATRQRQAVVRIMDLVWEGVRTESDPSPQFLTADLRRRLGELQFGAEDALPGKAAGAASVQILDALAKTNPVAQAMAGVLPVVMPDAAYEIRGHFGRSPSGAPEVNIEIVRIGPRRTTLRAGHVTGDDWPAAMRSASHVIAGALIPYLRGRRSDPWTHWRTPLPDRLLARYYRAAECRGQRRAEEALDAFEDALRDDPLNQVMRLHSGEIEEQLELFLDAWANYHTVVARTKETRHPWSARRTREHTWFIGRYRLAILLGYGRAAAQWLHRELWDVADPPEHGIGTASEEDRSRRDEERQRLRAELARAVSDDPWFRARGGVGAPGRVARIRRCVLDWRAWAAWRTFEAEMAALTGDCEFEPLILLCGGRRAPDADAPWRGGELASLGDVPRGLLVEEFLQIIAMRDLRRLWQGLVWSAPWRVATQRTGVPVSARNVRVAKRWIRVRIARTRYYRSAAMADGAAGLPPDASRVYREEIEGMLRRWNGWRMALRAWLYRRWGMRSASWHIYYSAACMLAIPLLPLPRVVAERDPDCGPPPEIIPWQPARRASRLLGARAAGREREALDGRLARASMACLDRFVHAAGTRAQSHARWAAADDPDLAGLRGMDVGFPDWARHSLGMDETLLRPRGVEVALVTASTMRQAALERAEIWRVRRDGLENSAQRELDWWLDDATAITAMADGCREYRSWKERLRMLETLRASSGGDASVPLVMRHGQDYDELDDKLATLAKSAPEVKGGVDLDRRLRGLASVIRLDDEAVTAHLDELGGRVYAGNATAGTPGDLRFLRGWRAQAWSDWADAVGDV